MKLDFAKNTKRNMVASAVNSGIKMLFPFVNRTMFLWLLGKEYLGLNGLFTSVIGMLSLAELGFSQAIVSSMYKPIADDDNDLVCAYLAFYRTVYRCVGAFVFAVGLCLLPFIRTLIKGDVPPDVDIHVLFLLHLANTSLSYFMFAYRGPVLSAYQRNDVSMNVHSTATVVQYVAVFLVLLLTRNYYWYVVTTIFFTSAANLVILRESKRLFPRVEPRGALDPGKRRKVVSDVKSIFLHKVGTVVSYSTDNTVISAFLGLAAVAVYGNYYYVASTVAGLVAMVYASMAGGFGNRIYPESKERNFELFMKATRLSLVTVAWCAAVMFAAYQPFIEMWAKGDPALVRHAATPFLMTVYFCVNQSRQTLLTFKGAAGLWREDRWKPVAGAFANLAMNISFVLYLPDEYKLDGVILSTILSYVFIQIPWEAHVVFTRFFTRREAVRYWRMQGAFALLAVALAAASWQAASFAPSPGGAGFVVKGAVAAAVASAVMLALFGKELKTAVSARRRG